ARVLRPHPNAPKKCPYEFGHYSPLERKRREDCRHAKGDKQNRQSQFVQEFSKNEGRYRTGGHCRRIKNWHERLLNAPGLLKWKAISEKSANPAAISAPAVTYSQ